ncbi:hypothetical protein TruAng_008264 [Truncatella angustata]|nr:hypothetical protein TruAng_008264 [Truncatella angustata]
MFAIPNTSRNVLYRSLVSESRRRILQVPRALLSSLPQKKPQNQCPVQDPTPPTYSASVSLDGPSSNDKEEHLRPPIRQAGKPAFKVNPVGSELAHLLGENHHDEAALMKGLMVDPSCEQSLSALQENDIHLRHPKLEYLLKLDKLWLRDACTCERCVNPSSHQKRFSTSDIPNDLPINYVKHCTDGFFEISWKHDFLTGVSHITRLSADRVYNSYFRGEYLEPFHTQAPKIAWNGVKLRTSSVFHDYKCFMDGGPQYVDAIERLDAYGIIFLRNVPYSEESVEHISKMLGIAQETFFGKTWDVISKPDPESIAYTSDYLGLHQDMIYLDHPPKIQVLHCLENSCEGGESMFSDGLQAAREFQKERWHTKILERFRVKYEYRSGGHTYATSRPVLPDFDYRMRNDQDGFSCQDNGERVLLPFWSPPFQSSDQYIPAGAERELRHWKHAAHEFKALLEDGKNVFEYKMKPGECVVFDNLRVLHGRRQFNSSSGKRWLRGMYVEGNSFKSKLQSLASRRQAQLAGHDSSLSR